MNYYVSPNGDDVNTGTRELPFRTLQFAKKAINKVKNDVDENMNIILMDGIHVLDSTLIINTSDQMPNNKILTIKADENVTPVMSGGIRITDWQPVN